MENGNAPAIDWPNILLQWGFLFAVLTVFLIPAFKFKNLAREYDRAGWVYFFLGLIVGFVGFNLGQVVAWPLRYYVVPPEYVVYLSPVLFLSAYLFYRVSYKFLKSYFSRSSE
jgi:hypothetical protein